ncbi:hypothetical protein HMPREF9985_00390 [Staphylococcus epidermidis NIHLM039]|nr:hypothetical protein HMPREF9985_00390 [Staphylococcus epidermidis NIHLM039]
MSSLSQVNADVLKQAQQRIQQDLLTTLAAFSIPEPLKSAVHHAVMLGGKRVRRITSYNVCYTKLLRNWFHGTNESKIASEPI